MHHNHHAATTRRSGRALDLYSARYLWADCLENVGISTSHNPMSLHGLL
jgi:hypothetical protein